jgi:hypothetical protein
MSAARKSRGVLALAAAAALLGGGYGCAHGVMDMTESASDGLTGDDCGGSCNTTSTSSSTHSTTTTTTTNTTSTSTTSGGSACDNRGSCDACANCAIGDSCSAQWQSCAADTDCSAFLDCLSGCADDTCANDCATAHPTGMDLYMQMVQCALCDACTVDCAAEGQGLCSP